MKKISIVTLLLCCLQFSLLAQKPKVMNDPTHDDKPIHFGFSLGLNAMNYHVEHTDYAANENVYVGVKNVLPGINIHAISNLRLSENIDLRALPGISFGDRELHFFNPRATDSVEDAQHIQSITSSYLEMPVLLKFKSKRLNNFRPYLLAGANFRYDLAVKKEYDPEDQIIMLSRPDYYGEIGYGMDFYLTYFKFGIELKYSFGLSNIFQNEDKNGPPPEGLIHYSNYIKSINSHILILSFHFE